MLEAPSDRWTYISPSQGIPLMLSRDVNIAIPAGTAAIVLETIVKYDTVPSTGLRTSYRKTRYSLPVSTVNTTILEQREE